MSNKHLNWVYSLTLGSASAKAVAASLADRAGGDGTCFCAQADIIERTELSPDTVQRSLKILKARGIVSAQRRTKQNGARIADLYRLNMPSETTSPKPHHAALDGGGLNRTVRSPKPHHAGVHVIEPISNPKENVRNGGLKGPGSEYPDYVERFWQAYPADRRIGKKATAAELAKLTAEERETAIEGAAAYARHLAREKVEPRYIVHPERFVKGRRFDDELARLAKTSGKGREATSDDKLRIWLRDLWLPIGRWHPDFGPAPGEPGTKATPELIAAAQREIDANNALQNSRWCPQTRFIGHGKKSAADASRHAFDAHPTPQ